jgi:hypothetical protein
MQDHSNRSVHIIEIRRGVDTNQASPVCLVLQSTTIVNPDSCAVIRSSCLVKTTESNTLARSY